MKIYTEEEVKKLCSNAFGYYAYTSISNQPYSDEELKEEFEEWFENNKKK